MNKKKKKKKEQIEMEKKITKYFELIINYIIKLNIQYSINLLIY